MLCDQVMMNRRMGQVRGVYVVMLRVPRGAVLPDMACALEARLAYTLAQR